MTYVNLKTLIPPHSWTTSAADAEAAVAAVSDADRQDKIKEFSDVWRDLKPHLSDLSHGKCWYSEAVNGGADQDVDHFRPKSKYWWLAFEPTNFRLSCIVCNRRRHGGGKGDSFPLVDETKRITTKSLLHQHLQENPKLLDPTSPYDCALLWFDEDGSARPKSGIGDVDADRVKESVDVLNIKHSSHVNGRRVVVDSVKRHLEDAKLAFATFDTDQTQLIAFNNAWNSLKELCSPKSSYSRAAICTIKGSRCKEHPWIDDIC